jgi:hypothetical protein
MKFLRIVQLFSLVTLTCSATVYAGAPDGPYGSNNHSAADMKWGYDGTRDALIASLRLLLGQEKNTFGPVFDAREGVLPADSELLSDFVPHILGIPGPETQLPNGEYFYSGAEPHNATREVAVISQGKGVKVLALALLQENYSKPSAAKELTVIVPAGTEPSSVMIDTFEGWAQGEIEKSTAILKDVPSSKIKNKLIVKTYSIGINQ